MQSYQKSALRGEYYPRQREDRHISWECDARTGCHARTDNAPKEEHPIITATKSDGQQILLPEDDDELDPTLDTEDDNQEDAELEEEKEEEDDVSLDNYEQLKELYRNCHASSGGNRYSYLVNCSPYNQQKQHPHSHIPKQHINSRYLNSLQSAAAHSDGLGDMFHRAPGTVTLTLMALLIIAIMLVELVDIFFYRRRRRSGYDEEDRVRRTTRRRLRTRAVRIPTVTVYESPVVYESEKASWNLTSACRKPTVQFRILFIPYNVLILTVYTITD